MSLKDPAESEPMKAKEILFLALAAFGSQLGAWVEAAWAFISADRLPMSDTFLVFINKAR